MGFYYNYRSFLPFYRFYYCNMKKSIHITCEAHIRIRNPSSHQDDLSLAEGTSNITSLKATLSTHLNQRLLFLSRMYEQALLPYRINCKLDVVNRDHVSKARIFNLMEEATGANLRISI